MSFQSTVSLKQGFGIVGELYDDSPVIAATASLNAASVVGRAVTYVSDGIVAPGGAGVFQGIISNPKALTLTGGLTPTLAVLINTVVECVTMGHLIVDLGDSANVGDKVIYALADGVLSAIAPSATPVLATHAYAYATVIGFAVGEDGLAVIALNYTPTLLPAAA